MTDGLRNLIAQQKQRKQLILIDSKNIFTYHLQPMRNFIHTKQPSTQTHNHNLNNQNKTSTWVSLVAQSFCSYYWDKAILECSHSNFAVKSVASPSHFVYEFLRKMFLMLYSVYWPNFIAWLPLLFEISGNMFIVIVFPQLLFFDVIGFKIYLSFLSESFPYMIKKVRTKM